MLYFKDAAGNIYCLSAEDINNGGMALLPEGCVEVSSAVAMATANPPPTTAQTLLAYEAEVRVTLDTAAQSWKYDSIVSAASYANSTVAQYKSDATALIAWRDAVWQDVSTIEAQITAGTTTLPATATAFIALLPAAPSQVIVAS